MNEFDLDQFESELQRLKPAAPPRNFVSRLVNELAPARLEPRQNSRGGLPATKWNSSLRRWFLWLVPATAALVLLLPMIFSNPGSKPPKPLAVASSVSSPIQADKVEIDQELLVTYDAVARLPNGAPVRFRCSEWLDDVVLRDSAQGILIQHRVPRLEIVPVGFE